MYGLCRPCEFRSLAVSFGSVLHVRLMDLIKVCGFAQTNTCVHTLAVYSDILYVVAVCVDVFLVVCVLWHGIRVYTCCITSVSVVFGSPMTDSLRDASPRPNKFVWLV